MLTRLRFLAAVGALCVAFSASGEALSIETVSPEQTGETLNVEDLLEVVDLGGVAASPDGRHVAFISRAADLACDCYRQTLYIFDSATNRIRKISDLGTPFQALAPNGETNGALMTAQPMWSSRGDVLAFIANRDGMPVLMVWRLHSSRTLPLPTTELVYAFTWSRRRGGQEIIYLTGGPNAAVEAQIDSGRQDGMLFGPLFAAIRPGTMPAAARVPNVSMWAPTARPAQANIAKGRLKKINVISSSEAAVDAQDEEEFMTSSVSAPYESFVERSPQPSSKANRTRASLPCRGTPTTEVWQTRSGREVRSCGERGASWTTGVAEFFWIDPVRGTASPWFTELAPGIFDGRLGKSCDLSGEAMICVDEVPSGPPRLVSVSSDGKKHILFDPNVILRSRAFGRVEKLTWRNQFGKSTWGFLVYPIGFKGTTPLPLVIVQYDASGFLRGGTGNEYPVHLLADSGFLVLSIQHPEPPGADTSFSSSTERHEAQWSNNGWQRSIQSSIDIAISDLVGRGLVDSQRVVYTGFSGGANQIDFALANGRRMATAISSNCCIGPESWPSTVANLVFTDFLHIVGWGNPVSDKAALENWSKVSPSLHVDEINTPILANSSQSEMLAANALWLKMRLASIPMELFVYPDEFHVKTRPRHRAAIYARNIDWLRFWVQGIESADPKKAPQNARWQDLRNRWQQARRLSSRN